MVGAGHRVELILCEGYAPAPSMMMSLPIDMSDAMVVDPRMDMSQAHRTQGSAPKPAGAPAHQDHGSCPYGASSALAAPPALAISAIVEQRASELAATSAQVSYFDVLFRAQSARGPPA
jgi:hypothetical protein